MRQSLWNRLKPYFWITVASVIYAVGFDWCYMPNQISSGGITGIGQMIHFFVPAIPVGVCVIVLNIPLFLLGWKLLGGRLLVTSLFAMAATSVLVDGLNMLVEFQPMDIILAAVFGGVLMGLSLGIVFQQGATTGGTDLIARLLKLKIAWLPMGKLLIGVDLVVIVTVAIAFRSLSSAMYGIIALYISGIVMDAVLYGMDTSKVAYIISDRSRDIVSAIDRELDRGVTILHGEGAYTGQKKQVLLCAFKQKQITALKRAVKEVDPGAFLIVCDAHDVLGDGFKEYKKDDI